MSELYREEDDELDPDERSLSWPVESHAGAVDELLLARVEILRDRCACLSRDYEDLTAELTEFRIAYHSALGQLYIELERARLRTARLRTALDIVAKTSNLPGNELQEWVELRTHGQAAKVGRLEDEVKADARVAAAAGRKREISAEAQRLLRRLYRKLAIRFHPDLQMDPDAKKTCERMMARIGDLYRARDLEGLEMIAETEGDLIKTVFLEPDEYRRWLQSRVQRLEQRVAQLEQQVDELWNSDLAVLKRRHQDAKRRGRDLFAEMIAAVHEDIREQEEELGRLQAELASLAPESQAVIASLLDDAR